MAAGSTFKRCGCRTPVVDETGQPVLDAHGRPKRRQLGAHCPKLRRPDRSWNHRHGVWYYVLELPAIPGDKWRQIKRGGYASQVEAQAALDEVRRLLQIADDADIPGRTRGEIVALILQARRHKTPLPDYGQLRRRCLAGQTLIEQMTVADWLTEWLASRIDLRPTTLRSYKSHVDLYLIPHLGHHRLDRLRAGHVQAMFADIAAQNEKILTDNAARKAVEQAARQANREGHRKAARAARAKLAGMPPYRRPVKAATQYRIRATLRVALSHAMIQHPLTINVAKPVNLPSGKRPKPLVWTEERVARWRKTGKKPGPVMVWTAEQTSTFLAHAAGHRLYALFHVKAITGPRRGELCGLHWTETDLQHASLTVTEQIVQLGWETLTGKPKSDAGDRTIALDTTSVAVLAAHKQRQDQERIDCGPGWIDTGLVFTEPDGSPLHPAKVTVLFHQLAEQADLPPIRLHDLRHGTATHALSAGVDIKIVQELLGHSSSFFTRDAYTSVVDEAKRAAAEAIAAQFTPPAQP